MDTPPQPPAFTLSYVFWAIVSLLGLSATGAAATLLGRRRSTSRKEDAEARRIDGETLINMAYVRLDRQQQVIDQQSAELRELRNVKQQLADWKSYARRCEQRLAAHKIDAPEFWQSGERIIGT